MSLSSVSSMEYASNRTSSLGSPNASLRIGTASRPAMRRVASRPAERCSGCGAWRNTSCNPPPAKVDNPVLTWARNGSLGMVTDCQVCLSRWRDTCSVGKIAMTPKVPNTGTKNARLKINNGLQGSGER
ncbi:hypothetical protein D3C75_883870 [compost metagenome]